MGNLEGKVAIVTGGSKGIGQAIARRFAADGGCVVVCARGVLAIEKTVHAIRESGGMAIGVPLDLRMPQSAELLVDAALEAFGRLDILVNNAGATRRGEFEELSDDDWADGFALKFFGAMRVTRRAWPYLKASSGVVVNISGAGGRTPGPQFSIGGSVNAALLSLTKSLADLGIRDGVQVNAVNPGTIRTDRLKLRLAAAMNEQGIDQDTAARQFVKESNITRIGEPEDVANLVAFLAGGEGRFLQGALIDIDGGATKTM